jgi:alpha-tubulin suppressor-like RCC1 family protein
MGVKVCKKMKRSYVGKLKFPILGTLFVSYLFLGAGPCGPAKPAVSTLDTGHIQQLVVGDSHACALIEGEVWCWGKGEQGQLGDGQKNDSITPVKVVEGLGQKKDPNARLAAAGNTTCLIKLGNLRCWGSMPQIQAPLEIPQDPPMYPIPTPITGLKGFRAVAVGSRHICVINGKNEVSCLGHNAAGQVGTGKDQVNDGHKDFYGNAFKVYHDKFQAVVDQEAIESKATKKAEVAKKKENLGTAAEYDLEEAKIKDLKPEDRPAQTAKLEQRKQRDKVEAKKVADEENAVDKMSVQLIADSIFTGENHTCAITKDKNQLKCWGNLQNYRMGKDVESLAIKVGARKDSLKLASFGSNHGCVLTGSSIACLGNNDHCQLGFSKACEYLDAGNNGSDFAELLEFSGGITDIAAGENFTCAIQEGVVKCWGANVQVVGASSNYSVTSLEMKDLGKGVVKIATGGKNVCAANSKGIVECWITANDSDTDKANKISKILANDWEPFRSYPIDLPAPQEKKSE